MQVLHFAHEQQLSAHGIGNQKMKDKVTTQERPTAYESTNSGVEGQACHGLIDATTTTTAAWRAALQHFALCCKAACLLHRSEVLLQLDLADHLTLARTREQHAHAHVRRGCCQ